MSTPADVEVFEYPDCRKVGVSAGRQGQMGLRKLFHSERDVDYYDREPNEG